MESRPKRVRRKLLVASLGVATVSYGACGNRGLAKQDAAADAAQVADAGDHVDAALEIAVGVPDAGVERQFIGNII
jgi:hypothetical protein